MTTRRLTLSHDDKGFRKWHKAIDNASASSSLVTRVEIETAPEGFSLELREHDSWHNWVRTGSYPGYTDALRRIKELEGLTDVTLRFSDVCAGVQNDGKQMYESFETIACRLRTLEIVFRAIQDRTEQNASATPIRCLTIENLQNAPLHGFTGSGLFKSVMKHIEELHLLVAVECSEHGPDQDLERIERTQFEPYLCDEWLAPLASQLTSLSLYFNEAWGTAPGQFDGDGLVFPRLKTLNLGGFVASRHGHLDWVLQQASLERLHLESCSIASHLHVYDHEEEKWKLRTEDWQQLPMGAYGFAWPDDRTFTFPGTWEATFDKIGTSLPNLREFRFGSRGSAGEHYFREPESMPTTLPKTRYITLDTGLLPSPWIEADRHDGMMQFGNNDESVWERKPGANPYTPRGTLNKAAEHEEADQRALEKLQKIIEALSSSSVDRL